MIPSRFVLVTLDDFFMAAEAVLDLATPTAQKALLAINFVGSNHHQLTRSCKLYQ